MGQYPTPNMPAGRGQPSDPNMPPMPGHGPPMMNPSGPGVPPGGGPSMPGGPPRQAPSQGNGMPIMMAAQQKGNRITPISKPGGIDVVDLLNERENRIAQRIGLRIQALQKLPAS